MKRILDISLVLIFISGQVNLTWATHFCGEIAVKSSLTIGQDPLDCGIGEMKCCDETSMTLDVPSILTQECCSNDYFSADTDDYFYMIESTLNNHVLFAASYIISLFDYTVKNNVHENLADSTRPLTQSDRQVLFQTFLL